jgi:hypothetical protein
LQTVKLRRPAVDSLGVRHALQAQTFAGERFAGDKRPWNTELARGLTLIASINQKKCPLVPFGEAARAIFGWKFRHNKGLVAPKPRL